MLLPSGCEECLEDPACVAAVVELTVLLAKTTYQVYEAISGEMNWENLEDVDRLVEVLVCLIRSSDGECLDQAQYFADIPANSKATYNIPGLAAEEPGLYHLLVEYLSTSTETDDVEVTT
ncbi:MAG: hypothetical protein KTR31_10265 [Myxococcales bacterium]|nr:hypothetical protein [Myxococcales bacterium]